MKKAWVWREVLAHHDPNSPEPGPTPGARLTQAHKDGQEKPGEEQGAEGAESVPAAPEQLCKVPQLALEEKASGLEWLEVT